jgi:hypothetical protein
VPIATARLRAVLEWLQLDADGEKKLTDVLVFSDETGEPVGSFRTSWITAVLKAHDVAPVWKSYNWTALTPECLTEFRRINLRWHDLRHEYASRLVEKNIPLAQVRDLLGHTSIITTERYDNQKLENLQAAAARLERGETFDPGPRESATPSICQVSVKSSVDEEPGDEIDRVRETSPNYGEDLDLENWLGGRDSNPDNVVQRGVHGWRSASFRSVLRGFSRCPLGFDSLRFSGLRCNLSLSVSPVLGHGLTVSSKPTLEPERVSGRRMHR